MALYIPDSGDIVWINFDPQIGREQAGRRPALVLSAAIYNRKTGLMLCCPITTKIKNYPFEVEVSGPIASVILADHIKNLDWQGRKVEKKGQVSQQEIAQVRAKLKTLLNL